MKLKTIILIFFLSFFGTIFLYGSTSNSWIIEGTEKIAEGELYYLILDEDGIIRPGIGYEKIPFDKEKITGLWKALQLNEQIFIGTGNNGEVYGWNPKLSMPQLLVKTKLIAVTSMVYLPDNKIIIAGIPGGEIFIYNLEDKSLKEFAKIDADNIWDMIYDYKRKLLFVATGSQGKIFAVDINGRVEEYVTIESKHIITLNSRNPYISRIPPANPKEQYGETTIYAGTAPDAQLIKIKGPGKFINIASFDATEVKAISFNEKEVYVIINKYKSDKVDTFFSESTQKSEELIKKSKSIPQIKPPESKYTSLIRITELGEVEELIKIEEELFLNLVVDKKRACASTGIEGRIICYDLENRSSYLLSDLDSSKVFDFYIDSNNNGYALGSEPPLIYRFNPKIEITPYYLTTILDGKAPSVWGEFSFTGKGVFKFFCRSGNTKQPDTGWEDWKEIKTKVDCNPARYLQLKVLFSTKDSFLQKLRIFYRNYNQAPKIKEIKFKYIIKEDGESGDSKSKEALPSIVSIKKRNYIKLEWDVENPDNDPLRYNLWYKKLESNNWFRITKAGEYLLKKEYIWDISTVPSGYYIIKIEASDELSNGKEFVKKVSKLSPPIPVDNIAPQIRELKITGKTVTGYAIDNLNIIQRIDYNIDGTAWLPVEPKDFVFDSQKEYFKFDLSENISPGNHILAIRAYDEVGNVSTVQLEFIK